MFSGRRGKWILVLALVLLALYAAYPPVEVPIKKVRVTEKVAQDLEEASEHGVKVGEAYVVKEEVVSKRFVPLARGTREERTAVIERREDGTVVKEITTVVMGRIKLGLDIAGGTELIYQLKPQSGERLGGTLADTIGILKERIDPSNVKEFSIQPVGRDRILIQVPRASAAEVERLKDRLTRMGELEFKLVVPRQSEKKQFIEWYKAAAEGKTVKGYKKVYLDNDETKDFYLVKEGEAEITGKYLARVYPTRDEYGRPAVGFTFNAEGTRIFAMLTERHLGWQLAIILDGVLKSAPVIESRIAGPGIIRGDFSGEEVDQMVTVLRAGSLPVDVQLLQESTVGPKLGMDSIHKGLGAIAVGGLLVLAFIGIYYMRCGLIADGALILNLVLLVGVLGFLGAALTLPGVAGILLTVGIAVDANVLIFERIREEWASGKNIRLALRNGYELAYSTIVDANVTTLLTAIILYIVGTGPVRGFAVTLSAGIVLSMFSALYVTRLAFETLIERGWLKGFRMLSVVGRTSLAFSGKRRLAYLASGALIAVGLVAFVVRGSALYDIDFTGGSLVYVSLTQPTAADEVRERLAAAGFAGAEVQEISTPDAVGGKATKFALRIRGIGNEQVNSAIFARIRQSLEDAGLLADGSLEASQDRQSLELKLKEALEELTLRKALAGQSKDPYELEHVRQIVPSEKLKASTFLIRLPEPGPLDDQLTLLGKVRTALGWAGAVRDTYSLKMGPIEGPPPSAEEQTHSLTIRLDAPVQPQVLETELARRQFGDLEMASSPDSENEFTLTGPLDRLESFKREMPTALELPRISLQGRTLRTELQEPISEQDLRVIFEQHDLSEVLLVPVGEASTFYRIILSSEPVKEKMRKVFEDLGRKNIEVTYSVLDQEPDAEGNVRLKMHLSQRMTMPMIRHYLEEAGLKSAGQKVILDQLPPTATTDSVTLLVPAEKKDQIQRFIERSFAEPRPIEKILSIGSVVAEEMKGRALLAVICASVIIVLYVAVRFHAFKFGVAAVIALIHDILITLGLVALADWSGVLGDIKINLAMLAAFLTILGYSLNDTIVVFDRIRENMIGMGRKDVDAEMVDRSINQTLSRTILTSLTTLMVVVVLYLLGGPVLQGLAYTLIIGVVVGTYSSVFIASPVLLDWQAIKKGTRVFFKILTFPLAAPFKVLGMLSGARSGR